MTLALECGLMTPLYCTSKKIEKTIVTVDIEYQKLFSRSVTRWLSLYRSLLRMLPLYPASNPYSIDKPTVVLKRFFGNSLSEFCSHNDICNHVWFAFIEQVQYIDKSNAVVEVVSCFSTEKTRMQERQSDVSSQVKSELRKFSEGKDQD